MAREIEPWRERGCSLSINTPDFSDREEFSREINEKFGEGGGLNADYRTVDACFNVASILGVVGKLLYGKDYVFKTTGLDEIILDFADQKTKKQAERILLGD